MDILTYYQYTNDVIFYNHALKIKQNDTDYRAHSHDAFEIILYKRGKITYTVNGQQYRLTQNDLVFARPFDIHNIQIGGDAIYERHNILFDRSLLPADIYNKIPKDLHVISLDNNQTVINLFKKMDFYCENLKDETLGLMLKNLIQEICVHIVLEAESSIVHKEESTNELVADAISYINENLVTLTGVEEICKALAISKSHLHHLFTKHLKISPKKYIITKRLALAQKEVLAGRKPTEVCLECGFADYSSFYRAYRNFFKSSPSGKLSPEKITISHDNSPQKSPARVRQTKI